MARQGASFLPQSQCAGRDPLPGKTKAGCQTSQSQPPSTKPDSRDLSLQPAPLEQPQCQGEKDKVSFQSPHPDCSCSRQDCTEQAGTGLSPHSHARKPRHHPASRPHKPPQQDSRAVPGDKPTHLQGDACTSPLLCPLYSQPCEGCSHHEGSYDQQDLWRAAQGS